MKAISLWQPWATLMAAGYKRIETRHWKSHDLRKGDIVAIHAAKRWDQEEYEMLLEDPYFRRYLTLAERRGLWSLQTPPRGAIIAIARFKEAVPTNLVVEAWLRGRLEERFAQQAERIKYWVRDAEKAFGHYGEGRWAWVFDAVRPIQPIEVRGQQGVWNWPTLNVPIDFLEERQYAPWAEEMQEAMPS